jgi:hypothetical protein
LETCQTAEFASSGIGRKEFRRILSLIVGARKERALSERVQPKRMDVTNTGFESEKANIEGELS